MDNVTILPRGSLGRNFIAAQYLPKGEDEYYLRNRQSKRPAADYRHLRSGEIADLIRNNNSVDSWDDILVTDQFDPDLVRDNEFFGLVRIGSLRNVILQHHDLKVPAGITKSRIISCDIGDDAAIHNVNYLAYYIIGNRTVLATIDEMLTTDHAKFGNGILKDDENEEVRVWVEIMNETGGRKILPFDSIIPADAYLWAKYRDDRRLQKRLTEITQARFDSRRGYYGVVGEQCVIKDSRILKDVLVGDHSYIKGANKIKNVTLHSSAEEPTQIGEGVELVNGIVGHGCHIFYGCKAVRFILGNNSNLKYGGRLINSFLGENSTISCCEVLHNLIFPAHEQHHNNSFLIASVVMGQSNIAAGATIGSNHNSRSNDNEIQAGRGFWPGLCTSIKHSCRFVSFTLLAKADYPAEMDIRIPFSLVNNNTTNDRLEIIPAYWWQHNMYALARNPLKFRSRDTRINKAQNIEFDSLAPDTVEEIIEAIRLLEVWTANAALLQAGTRREEKNDEELRAMGADILQNDPERASSLVVLGERMEKSRRNTVIIKVADGYGAYRDMLCHYAVRNCVAFCNEHPEDSFDAMVRHLSGKRITAWTNLGGQIIPTEKVDALRAEIGSGSITTWDAIHARYNELWSEYPLEKQRHAFAILCLLYGVETLDRKTWHQALDRGVAIQEYVRDRVYASRKKDDDNPFRQATFRNRDEMLATVGTAEENSFVKQVQKETKEFKQMVRTIKKRG
ncbi:MAG: DUF4954 family protein [Chitinispirillaceae bacterium]|nr:DUF4954 family protein [Chitinispirillaceae bacterium]